MEMIKMIYLDKAATSYHKPEEMAEAVYEAVKATGNSSHHSSRPTSDDNRIKMFHTSIVP